MKLPDIDPKRFYTVGKYCFFVSFVITAVRILDTWNDMKSYDIVSSIAYGLFQLMLWGFFSHLARKEDIREVKDGDIIKMQEALESLNLESDNNNAKKSNGKKTGHGD